MVKFVPTKAQLSSALSAIIGDLKIIERKPGEHAQAVLNAHAEHAQVLLYLSRNFNAHQVTSMCLAALAESNPTQANNFDAQIQNPKVLAHVVSVVGKVLKELSKRCAAFLLQQGGQRCSA